MHTAGYKGDGAVLNARTDGISSGQYAEYQKEVLPSGMTISMNFVAVVVAAGMVPAGIAFCLDKGKTHAAFMDGGGSLFVVTAMEVEAFLQWTHADLLQA